MFSFWFHWMVLGFDIELLSTNTMMIRRQIQKNPNGQNRRRRVRFHFQDGLQASQLRGDGKAAQRASRNLPKAHKALLGRQKRWESRFVGVGDRQEPGASCSACTWIQVHREHARQRSRWTGASSAAVEISLRKLWTRQANHRLDWHHEDSHHAVDESW